MPTYIIFDRKTGRAVQTHTQPEGLVCSREDILAHVDAGHERSTLEVRLVEAETLAAGGLCRVDPRSGKLQPADAKQAPGFGVGSLASAEMAGLPRAVRTVYQPEITGPTRSGEPRD